MLPVILMPLAALTRERVDAPKTKLPPMLCAPLVAVLPPNETGPVPPVVMVVRLLVVPTAPLKITLPVPCCTLNELPAGVAELTAPPKKT